ncbi:hypothetical protein J1N35_004225 [Gossypium stocksii]|uniref:Uncharacterized protein n=1 Tax=Gossypium stocksii TaxID=47602 RepID=A0A9D3WDP1_9ROSI|nr:hypothetical protein J1N35_004225 [Gossypium stocksii]
MSYRFYFKTFSRKYSFTLTIFLLLLPFFIFLLLLHPVPFLNLNQGKSHGELFCCMGHRDCYHFPFYLEKGKGGSSEDSNICITGLHWQSVGSVEYLWLCELLSCDPLPVFGNLMELDMRYYYGLIDWSSSDKGLETLLTSFHLDKLHFIQCVDFWVISIGNLLPFPILYHNKLFDIATKTKNGFITS